MPVRKLLLLVSFILLLTGCVGDLEVPEEPMPAATTLVVTGLEDSQSLDVNFFDLTVTDPDHKYQSFQYAVDSEKSYLPGSFGERMTLTISSEGSHILYIKGMYANGLTDEPMLLRFNITTLERTANGKYRGDSLLYYGNYSSMSINFVTYSGARSMGNISGRLIVGDTREFDVTGVSIDNQQWPADVELLLNGAVAPEYMRVSGEGYYHLLNLRYVGVDTRNSAISGDIRLYREDIDKFLVAYCTSMRAYNQGAFPEIRAALTLYSFDNRYFYGHVRLINPVLKKILTYDVKGDAGAAGLSGNNNGIPLTFSKPFGYLVKATPAPPTTGSGFLTVAQDEGGNHRITQFGLNLGTYGIYDSMPESISMMKSFPKQ